MFVKGFLKSDLGTQACEYVLDLCNVNHGNNVRVKKTWLVWVGTASLTVLRITTSSSLDFFL